MDQRPPWPIRGLSMKTNDEAQASDFAALVALTLFLGMILVWARVLA